jgi:hypothetical protein
VRRANRPPPAALRAGTACPPWCPRTWEAADGSRGAGKQRRQLCQGSPPGPGQATRQGAGAKRQGLGKRRGAGTDAVAICVGFIAVFVSTGC